MSVKPHLLLLMWLCIIIAFKWAATAIVPRALLTPSPPHRTKQFSADCGTRVVQRQLRSPKIIAGSHTKEGQFPWQASLELLHPSLGFLGHWCGAVLIHQYWVLSAAHCVHNDLFNLPLPPLWTVVLGEYDRAVESGYEQRIPVEKIVLHRRYHNFLHDLVLMKLSRAADLSATSNVRRICLPFPSGEHDDRGAPPTDDGSEDPLETELVQIPDKMENFLRSVQGAQGGQAGQGGQGGQGGQDSQGGQSVGKRRNVTLPSMKELMSTKILSRLRNAQRHKTSRALRLTRRRNDKLMRLQLEADEHERLSDQKHQRYVDTANELPYTDCVATGWGKTNATGDLTDLLLKTNVPLHSNGRCKEAYGDFVRIHRGHLCAGKLNGRGGTCVGDSGGPLQCRLTRSGPWILVGITSFGSGCAVQGYPDVYTRTSYYMKWIQATIAHE